MPRSLQGLSREQLLIFEQMLIYAREVAQQFRTSRELRQEVARYEEQMRALVASSMAALEEEREWMALEVHDRLAQTLVAAFQQLQALEGLTPVDSEARRLAVRASVLLREGIRESREIMNDLHPASLDEFGLVRLIHDELRHFEEETGTRTRFDARRMPRMPKAMEIGLYRIYREALANVRRHATSVENVVVTLECSDHHVTLGVRDDGCGFDVAARIQSNRVGGLLSMRRRAEVLRGTLEMTSILAEGTEVVARVPSNRAEAKENGGNDSRGLDARRIIYAGGVDRRTRADERTPTGGASVGGRRPPGG